MATKQQTRAEQSKTARGRTLLTQAYRLSQIAVMLTLFTFVVGTPIRSVWAAVASVVAGVATLVVIVAGWMKMRRGAKLLGEKLTVVQRGLWIAIGVFTTLIVISALPYLVFWHDTVTWVQCRNTALTLQGQQQCYQDFVPQILRRLGAQ